ncbi:oxidoreductase [Planoprotostelium fungivorum]|uniref:Oxidoreductase n=1 Tax=Planoprotostelium fungivorum TaxID=1890364 RepID=A0A2P6NKW7_9EUKA|nr:oxidoreductase [Planoprotostelium fungivorum]
MTTQTLTITKEDAQGSDLFKTDVSPITFGRSPKITKTDVDGVTGAFLLHDVLNQDECLQLIDFTCSLGYSDAPITTSLGPVMMKDVRDNTRLLLEASPDFLVEIFRRIESFLPSEQTVGRWKGKLCGLNERLRFYKYEPGQTFAPHFDGDFQRGKESSLFTFIIYLNDGFEGGHTTFFTYHKGEKKDVKVSPKAGTALLFYHGRSPLSPLHEGSSCEDGQKRRSSTSECIVDGSTACYYELHPKGLEAHTAWEYTSDVYRQGDGADPEIGLKHLIGHANSFQTVRNRLRQLNVESTFYHLEIQFCHLKSAAEAENVYRTFIDLISPHFPNMEGKPREPTRQKSPPTLKQLSALCIQEGKEETKQLPPGLADYVSGVQSMSKEDPSSSKSSNDGTTGERKRNFGFCVEIAEDRGSSYTDNEGAHVYHQEKGRFYPSHEQRQWRHSYLRFMPADARPTISYDFSEPHIMSNKSSMVHDLSTSMNDAIHFVNIFDQGEVNDKDRVKLWQMAGSSSGGTHTQHNSMNMDIYREYLPEEKKHKKTRMTWEHVDSVRDGIRIMERAIQHEKSAWRDDSLTCIIHVTGSSSEELEFHSDRILQLARDFGAGEEVITKCWFSTQQNIECVKKLSQFRDIFDDISSLSATFDLPLEISQNSAENFLEKDLERVNKLMLRADATGTKEKEKKKKGIFQRMFGRDKVKKETPVSTAHRIEDKDTIWMEVKDSVKLSMNLIMQRHTTSTPDGSKDTYDFQLGCLSCRGILHYRSPCLPGPHDPVVSGSLCHLHKSLLLCDALQSVPKLEEMNPLTIKWATKNYGGDHWDPQWATGFVDPKLFLEKLKRFECGGVLSRSGCWREMSVNQMLLDGR